MPKQLTVYLGTCIDTPSLGELRVFENAAIFVNSKGVIERIVDLANLGPFTRTMETIKDCYGDLDDSEIEIYQAREFSNGKRRWWFPGFVDTHTHPCQHPNAGIFGKSTLLDWLNTYTFPLEALLSDEQKSHAVYSHYLHSSLRAGTTTGCYYAARSPESTNILTTLCHTLGTRALIGRTNMDTTLSPIYYRDSSPTSALSSTKATITHIKSLDPNYSLLQPIITPRFAPSCTSSLLTSLGALAASEDLPIQTHISENPDEVALVQSLFPEHDSYAHTYDAFGLLTEKTVLAHCIHLSPAEINLIAERKGKVSHCPVSNSCLSSGLCPVRKLLDEGIEVGLGTDVSGGFSGSVLTAAREAGVVSRILAGEEGRKVGGGGVGGGGMGGDEEGGEGEGGLKEQKEKERQRCDRMKLSPEECLYLATKGGANCLGLGDKVGVFEVGKEWDAQLIEVEEVNWRSERSEQGSDVSESQQKEGVGEGAIGGKGGLVEFWGEESWNDKIAKWVFCGDDRNTTRVYVKGRLVHCVEGSTLG